MNLYFHIDRGDKIKGTIDIPLEPCNFDAESVMSVWTPFIEHEFISHLQRICLNGLSLHGATYLVANRKKRDSIVFTQVTIEIFFEYIRYKYYQDKPSRLQSFFAWKELDDAIKAIKMIYLNRNGQKCYIYKVSPEGQFCKCDMNLLSWNLDAAKMERNARSYWEGRPMKGDQDYQPAWEILLKCPIKVLGRVMLDPFDGMECVIKRRNGNDYEH
jgi:hypothetical protein